MAGKLEKWLPPAVITHLKPLLRHGVYYSGRFPDWETASKAATGYDADLILEQVKCSTLEVLAGRAVFERDSVLFEQVQHSFPVLAGLLRAAVENGGRLSVMDYGGALGSSYFQCRNFLDVLSVLSWNIVEQPHFVRCGREAIVTEQLRFFFTVPEVLAETQPDVALLSSVLPYLPDPYAVLSELVQHNIKYLIIDRTPFAETSTDVITVQHVPASIYPASYPCRIFNRQALIARLAKRYELVAEFASLDRSAVANGLNFDFGGMIFRIKDRN